MKITQEVRDFAAKQNASADNFLAVTNPSTPTTLRPEPVEGLSFLTGQEQEGPSTSSARTDMVEAEAEAGMAQMSEKFRENGSEVYLPATE